MDVVKLAKLLSLSSSPNDQEALSALRAARRLLTAAGADFVDLAGMVEDGGRVEELERDLEDARRRLRQALAAPRPAPAPPPPAASLSRGCPQCEQTNRELRRQIRQLTAANQALSTELKSRTEELQGWQAAHNALDSNLRQSSQERFHLKSKLRQQQMEMERILSEVRGVINVSSRLSDFVKDRSGVALTQ